MEFSLPGVIAGVLVGVLGFLPLYLSSRSLVPGAKPSAWRLGLLSAGFPLIFMLVSLLVCYKVAPAVVPSFGITMAAVLLVLATGYALWYRRKHMV